MFREMRRTKQALPQEECIAVLERGTSGVLALLGDDDYPYAVPLSYVYANGRIYFHCAKAGHKIDAVRKCSKASFCVIDQDQVDAPGYTTHYRSVIAFGHVRVMEEDELRAAMDVLAKKYHPADQDEGRRRAIEQSFPALAMLELDIEHLTGKISKKMAADRAAAQP